VPGALRLTAPGAAAALRLHDALVVAGSLWLCAAASGRGWRPEYAWVAVCAAALFVLMAEVRGAYRSWRAGGLAQEAGGLLLAWIGVLFALLLLGFATKTSGSLSRATLLTWAVLGPVALVAARVGLRQLARRLRAGGRNLRRVAIAGAGELGQRVAATIEAEAWMGFQLCGFFDDRRRALVPARAATRLGARRRPRHAGTRWSIRGGLEALVAAARAGEIDVVYVTLPLRAEERIKQLVRELSGTRSAVYLVPDVADFSLLRSRWMTLGAIPAVSLLDSPLDLVERAIKRSEDVALALAALSLVALPMLAIALAIKLGSRGPVVFRQRRYGLDGREITVLKFRTMRVCEAGSEFRQARRGDPRVTRLGRVLRATSLDELPQLFNVLRGEMSVVGPPPPPTLLDDRHRELIEGYSLRHRMKPGITGWAQVNGYRGETDTLDKMQGRVRHDIEYIRRWSIGLDLKILALTLVRGFAGRNAY
jgi:putative colanic acid biosynthesis UDP-glucose lipid carrier transferase